MNSLMHDIEWKINLRTPVARVFDLVTSDEGRRNFWAESAIEKNGIIHFMFPNGETHEGPVLRKIQNEEFTLEYFGSTVSFLFAETENGGTVLTLSAINIPEEEYTATAAGWVSVLLALKAYADFGEDIRNHDTAKSWPQKFVDN